MKTRMRREAVACGSSRVGEAVGSSGGEQQGEEQREGAGEGEASGESISRIDQQGGTTGGKQHVGKQHGGSSREKWQGAARRARVRQGWGVDLDSQPRVVWQAAFGGAHTAAC